MLTCFHGLHPPLYSLCFSLLNASGQRPQPGCCSLLHALRVRSGWWGDLAVQRLRPSSRWIPFRSPMRGDHHSLLVLRSAPVAVDRQGAGARRRA